jgi:hypothetical protein
MTLSINERKLFRRNLLIEIYTRYFDDDGRPIRLFKNELDMEKQLAFQYLVEKGFIKMERQGVTTYITLTVNGIDTVESNFAEASK